MERIAVHAAFSTEQVKCFPAVVLSSSQVVLRSWASETADHIAETMATMLLSSARKKTCLKS